MPGLFLFSPTQPFFIKDTPGRSSAATPPPPFGLLRAACGPTTTNEHATMCQNPRKLLAGQQEGAVGEGGSPRVTGGWGAISTPANNLGRAIS